MFFDQIFKLIIFGCYKIGPRVGTGFDC